MSAPQGKLPTCKASWDECSVNLLFDLIGRTCTILSDSEWMRWCSQSWIESQELSLWTPNEMAIFWLKFTAMKWTRPSMACGSLTSALWKLFLLTYEERFTCLRCKNWRHCDSFFCFTLETQCQLVSKSKDLRCSHVTFRFHISGTGEPNFTKYGKSAELMYLNWFSTFGKVLFTCSRDMKSERGPQTENSVNLSPEMERALLKIYI